MEGAARIMLQCSNPVQQCSTTVGRSLFEWFCAFEDLYCIIAAYESILPRYWRQENVRVREIFAQIEYEKLKPEQRKRRVLDDLWAHLYNSGPQVRDVIAATTSLNSLHGEAKWERAAQLEATLRVADQACTEFMKSSLVLEVLELALPQVYENKHVLCCPPFPLKLIVYKCPEAAVFKIASLCLQTYIRAVLLRSLQAEMGPDDELIPLGEPSAADLAVELCQVFAGLEAALPNTPEIIIPCQAPMMIAALACPAPLRLWVYCKLQHLESLGQPLSAVVKEQFATQWNMPEILSGDLQAQCVSTNFVTEKMGGVSLAEDSDADQIEDDTLDSLTQLRGVFLASEGLKSS